MATELEGKTTDLVAYLLEKVRELERQLKLEQKAATKMRRYLTSQLDSLESSVKDHEELRDILFDQPPDSSDE